MQGGVDGCLQLPLPSIYQLNQIELTTSLTWSFFGSSLGIPLKFINL
jgi:hypothetical protein